MSFIEGVFVGVVLTTAIAGVIASTWNRRR
jgi:hypothetical protein